MKLLIDTNILIPLEPTRLADIEASTGDAATLLQLSNKAGAIVLLHPRQLDVDLANDNNLDRRELRRTQALKYNVLANPPPIKPHVEERLGPVREGSNDWVDQQLIAALAANACTFLVTEDKNILKKAKRVGLEDRVLTLADAIEVLQDLFDRPVEPPPAVRKGLSYELDADDSFWDSFREDYPGFDAWLARAFEDHRPVFVIDGNTGLAGVVILKKEEDHPKGTSGKVLKICSFKVSDEHSGNRYGELLLKAVFNFAEENKYDWAFVEVLDKHPDIIALFSNFGFREVARKQPNELVMSKPIHPEADPEAISGLEYAIRYGPKHLDWSKPAYMVPIQPQFEDILFPDRAQDQPRLIEESRPFGNAMRKAYLCNAPTKQLEPGSILFFYRSQDTQAVTAVAVVEDVLRSVDPDVVAAHVARRTVYSIDEIRKMAVKREVLAIRFRQAILLRSPIRLEQMIAEGKINRVPQSIARLTEEGKQWLIDQVKQQLS